MSWLSVQGLSFGYGKDLIFEHLNLEVEKGQIFCLMGPNGCGKTTLQHCILNFLKPRSGKILLDGKAVDSCRPRELAEKMAYVPQNHTRSFAYPAVDVVSMGSLRRHKILSAAGESERKLALYIMEQLHIAHLAERGYTSLSGGELQMVLIARALCQKSEMIILDEPTAHLDIGKSQDVLACICALSREHGKTILLAAHDFNQALYFQDEGCDVRMALMHEGRLSFSEVPLKLLSSSLLEDTWKIGSSILETEAEGRKRHYLVIWKKA